MIGKKLKRLRQQVGLSQAELATRVGVSRRTLQDWEAGLKTPRTDNLIALSSVLEVPPGWFHDSDFSVENAVAEAVSDLESIYHSLGETLERLKTLTGHPTPTQLSLVREKSTEPEIG